MILEGAVQIAVADTLRVIESATFAVACLGVAALTAPLTIMDIAIRARASVRACWNVQTFAYFVLLTLGNMIAAAIVLTQLLGQPPADFSYGKAALGTLFGVFAFQYVVREIKLSIYNKGVLALADWVDKSRNWAIDSASRNHDKAVAKRVGLVVVRLNKLSDVKFDGLLSSRTLSNAKLGPAIRRIRDRRAKEYIFAQIDLDWLQSYFEGP